MFTFRFFVCFPDFDSLQIISAHPCDCIVSHKSVCIEQGHIAISPIFTGGSNVAIVEGVSSNGFFYLIRLVNLLL